MKTLWFGAGMLVVVLALAIGRFWAADQERGMTTEECWSLIAETTPPKGAGTERHVEEIISALGSRTPGEVVSFDRFVREQLDRAYRWDLWAVAYIAMGGCSDDGFEHFGLWLIARGREYFERSLENPERAVDDLVPGEYADCESLLYAAAKVYEAKTGNSLPRHEYTGDGGSEPEGEEWTEGELRELYPQVARRFKYRE